MIAIPNMDKPKNCDKCPIRIAELFGVYYKDGKSKRIKITGCDSSKYNGNTLAEDHKLMYKDCPLIEIIPCKECVYNTDNTDSDNRGWCYKHGIDIIGFCSEGERESDEKTL